MNHLIRAVDLVIPVFLVIVLGYVVGRRAVFDRQGATVLNRLVIGFALPATLFVGTVAQTRSDLFEQLPLFGLIAVGLLGLYLVILVLLRYVFRRELHESALLALAATQPMFAFMGIPVLSGLLGPTKAELPIAIAGILVNVIMVPLTIILLQHPSSSTSPYRVARADGPGAPLATGATTSIRVDRRGPVSRSPSGRPSSSRSSGRRSSRSFWCWRQCRYPRSSPIRSASWAAPPQAWPCSSSASPWPR